MEMQSRLQLGCRYVAYVAPSRTHLPHSMIGYRIWRETLSRSAWCLLFFSLRGQARRVTAETTICGLVNLWNFTQIQQLFRACGQGQPDPGRLCGSERRRSRRSPKPRSRVSRQLASCSCPRHAKGPFSGTTTYIPKWLEPYVSRPAAAAATATAEAGRARG